MPLVELATLRLLPSVTPGESSFTQLWERALRIASSAAAVPFRLYQSGDVYYFLGGWRTGADHIAFLSTPDAVELAREIGKVMTVDVVRHIEGDIAGLATTADPKLRVTRYQVPETKAAEWEKEWNALTGAGAGGWDASASVQKQHKAFKEMGEATNSASAFGGMDDGGPRNWIWVEGAGEKNGGEKRQTSNGQLLESLKPVESFEMELTIG
jgi:hypothetical protein